MQEKLNQIRQETIKALEAVADSAAIDAIKVRVLGKKGELTALLRSMGQVAAEERPKIGQMINETRARLDELIEEKLHIKAQVAESAEECVAIGTGCCFDFIDELSEDVIRYGSNR